MTDENGPPDSDGAEGRGRFDKDTDVPSKGPVERTDPKTKRNPGGWSLRAFVLLCGCSVGAVLI